MPIASRMLPIMRAAPPPSAYTPGTSRAAMPAILPTTGSTIVVRPPETPGTAGVVGVACAMSSSFRRCLDGRPLWCSKGRRRRSGIRGHGRSSVSPLGAGGAPMALLDDAPDGTPRRARRRRRHGRLLRAREATRDRSSGLRGASDRFDGGCRRLPPGRSDHGVGEAARTRGPRPRPRLADDDRVAQGDRPPALTAAGRADRRPRDRGIRTLPERAAIASSQLDALRRPRWTS